MNLLDAVKILKIKDVYDISEIKKNYKKESLRYHPDRGGDSKKFILIKEAYDLLISNSKKPKNTVMDEIDVNLLRYYIYYTKDKPIFKLPIIEKYINRPIQNHLDQYKYYELTPTLSRVFKREVFYMHEHDIYIPLWHYKLVFYEKINVSILPILPNHISIDDNNDIYYEIDDTKTNEIIIDGISISFSDEEYNNKKIIAKGIPRIKSNIYDISEISDIILLCPPSSQPSS